MSIAKKRFAEIIAGLFLFVLVFLSYGLTKPNFVGAAGSASISISPASGSHKAGDEFTFTLVVSGGGQAYTSFKADVTTSNLTVTRLTRNPQLFAWEPFADYAPNEGNLSFGSGVPNSTTADVTVYTVTAKGNAEGTATVTIANGHVYTGELTDLIGSMNSASYTITGTGVTPTCTDKIQNGDETGVDCGGSCNACEVVPPQVDYCADGVKNNGETGVDCGGSCAACPTKPATCTDKVRNGSETGIDCGGSCPNACKVTKPPVSGGTTTTTTPPAPVGPTVDALTKLTTETEFLSAWKTAQATPRFLIDVVAPDSTVVQASKQALTGVTFIGKGVVGTKVDLFIFSTQIHKTTTVDAETNWKVVLDEPLSAGDHTVYAYLTDKDSNKNYRPEGSLSFNVDAATGTIKKVSMKTASSVTPPTTDTTTYDTTPTVPEKKFDMKWVYGGVGLVVLIIIIITAILLTKKKKSDDSDNGSGPLGGGTGGMDSFTPPSSPTDSSGFDSSQYQSPLSTPTESPTTTPDETLLANDPFGQQNAAESPSEVSTTPSSSNGLANDVKAPESPTSTNTDSNPSSSNAGGNQASGSTTDSYQYHSYHNDNDDNVPPKNS